MAKLPQLRYEPGRYRDCQWCHGRGCPGCDTDAKKDYEKAFPNGPKPIAAIRTDDADGIAMLKEAMGGPALEKAFAPGGGDIESVMRELAKIGDRTHVPSQK